MTTIIRKNRCFAIWNILGTYFTIYLYIFFHCERWMSWCIANPTKKSCAPSEYSDKPGHLPNLIRVITVRMKKHWVLIVTPWAHNEDSGHTGWMPRLIWDFAGCTDHFACFVMLQLKYCNFQLSRRDNVCPIILNYALLKRLTCQDLHTVANYLWQIWIRLTMTNIT